MMRIKVSFKIGTKEMKKIEAMAESQEKSISEVIRKIFYDALSDEHDHGIPKSFSDDVTNTEVRN
jgi:hypothetical protein